jgi:hypothetical protein
MPKGAVLSEGSSGDNITHFAALRIRATGNGSALEMRILSLDDIKIKNLVYLPLSLTGRVFQTRIINFVEQRASLEFKTQNFGEKFRIRRITVFMKEIATSHPGN